MNRNGSTSSSSSDSQATFLLPTTNHWLTIVVLPKPAEAEIRVRREPCESPLFKRLIKSDRDIAPGGGGGMKSFDVKMEMGTV
jgi:hypothetical protein